MAKKHGHFTKEDKQMANKAHEKMNIFSHEKNAH